VEFDLHAMSGKFASHPAIVLHSVTFVRAFRTNGSGARNRIGEISGVAQTFLAKSCLYSPSSQIPMNEVQVLQIPHTRCDLRRHVDETVETETMTKRHEFPSDKVKVFARANPSNRHRLGGIPSRCRSTRNAWGDCVAHD